jgi:hypothetical protein
MWVVVGAQLSHEDCNYVDEQTYFFFDKGNILISIRYQLHPAFVTTQYPNDSRDASSQKVDSMSLVYTSFQGCNCSREVNS